MEINEEILSMKKYYHCEPTTIESLNIIYFSPNTTLILWNRFQIFVYQNFEFENATKIILPEYQIQDLIVSNNYLICVDCSDNIHVTSLKFKNALQKRFKSSFQPRELHIKAVYQYDENRVLSLKYEAETFLLLSNKINTEFQVEKKVILVVDKDDNYALQETNKCLLYSYQVKEYSHFFKETFKVQNMHHDYSLVLISFDRIGLYACLFSPKMPEDEIRLIKLYTCPISISNVEVVEINDSLQIVIGLTVGSIIRLPLDLSRKPIPIHLNKPLHKYTVSSKAIIFTDGETLWKAKDPFSDEIEFKQYFVKHVKDFVICGDQVVCTTFANLIYLFQLDDEDVYIKPQPFAEYCSAEKLLNNSEYLHKIFDEIEKNNDILKKLDVQGNYITALALSHRQEIVDKAIDANVIVYEDFQDANNENPDLILTEEIAKYFEGKPFLILLKLTTNTLQHMFTNLLTNVFKDLKLHITLAEELKVIQTTSLRFNEQFKKANFLIPLRARDMMDASGLNVHVKLILDIPGSLDEKQVLWSVLYNKEMVLNSEHFINIDNKTSKQVSLKECKESIGEVLMETSAQQFKSQFKIIDQIKSIDKEWAFYVKLPNNYKDILKNQIISTSFSLAKAKYLAQNYKSEEFLQSSSNIQFVVGSNKVKVEIINDGFSHPMLKVTSENIKIAFHIRNFFANLVHKDFCTYEPGMEFINHNLYATTENLQKAVRDSIKGSRPSEEILKILEQFERNIVGSLPI